MASWNGGRRPSPEPTPPTPGPPAPQVKRGTQVDYWPTETEALTWAPEYPTDGPWLAFVAWQGQDGAVNLLVVDPVGAPTSRRFVPFAVERAPGCWSLPRGEDGPPHTWGPMPTPSA